MMLYGRPMIQAVGTSSAVGPIIAVPAVIGYIWAGWGVAGLPPLSAGFVNLPGFAVLVPASVLAAPYGVRLAHVERQVTRIPGSDIGEVHPLEGPLELVRALVTRRFDQEIVEVGSERASVHVGHPFFVERDDGDEPFGLLASLRLGCLRICLVRGLCCTLRRNRSCQL